MGEMLQGLWERLDATKEALSGPVGHDDRMALQRERAQLEQALGLRREGQIRTGDSLVDYWIGKMMSGEISLEDMDLEEAP